MVDWGKAYLLGHSSIETKAVFLSLYQVAGAVVKSGGHQIQIESDEFVAKNGPVKTGETAVTGPGNLPCKIVIHAVGRISFFCLLCVCRKRRHSRVSSRWVLGC